MRIMLISGSIILPVVMLYLQKRWLRLRDIFNYVAILATLIFGNVTSLSIYKVLIDKTVFMTSIHAILLNPLFLISGAYMGIYVLYRLLLLTMEEQQ